MKVGVHFGIVVEDGFETSLRGQFQNETKRSHHHPVQLDHVGMLQGREDRELLLEVAKSINDGSSCYASIAREDGTGVWFVRLFYRVVWVLVLVVPLLGECLECDVNF